VKNFRGIQMSYRITVEVFYKVPLEEEEGEE
jgi:hypothetical protein